MTKAHRIRMSGLIVMGLIVLSSRAATITVDPNGIADFTTIQEAINTARHFDTIIVHPGIYNEHISYRGKVITITSEDPNDNTNTVLDGRGSGDIVSFVNAETDYAVLRGFTIRNGERGVFCRGSSTAPLIDKCLITSNITGIGSSDRGKPTITNCIIEANTGIGISKCYGSVTSSMVQANGGHGMSECHGKVSFCEIRNNNGAGMFIQYGAMNNCLIVGNKGHGYDLDNDPSLWQGSMTNCTVVGNGNNGINIRGNYSGDRPCFRNCIIAFNAGFGVYASDNLKRWIEFHYCCFEGNARGWRNSDYWNWEWDINECIYEKPWFVDSGFWDNGLWHEGDYHLMSKLGTWDSLALDWIQFPIDSPCLDRGDPSMATGDEPLPNGGIINIGVYGGTLKASMSGGPSPICTEFPEMDFNRDCKVNLLDLRLFTEHWLECNLEPRSACNVVIEEEI